MLLLRKYVPVLYVAFGLSVLNAYADDTEIFFSDADADVNQNAPAANVMVLLDSSGSMDYCEDRNCDDDEQTRMEMTKQAFSDMVDALPDRVNLGLGRFYDGREGQVIFPVSEMSAGGRAAIKYTVNEIDPTGGTPTYTAYNEMAKYMLGEDAITSDRFPTSACVNMEVIPNCEWLPVSSGGGYEYEGPWISAPALTSCGSLPAEYEHYDCRYDYGSYQPIAGTCDTEDDSCEPRYEGAFEDIDGSCNASEDYCEVKEWSAFGPWGEAGWFDDDYVCSNYEKNRGWCREDTKTSRRCSWFGCRNVTEYRKQTAESFRRKAPVYYERSKTIQVRAVKLEQVCGTPTAVCKGYASISNDGKYLSPMNAGNQCERNYIVMMTDGEPNGDTRIDDNPDDDRLPDCDDAQIDRYGDLTESGSYSCQYKLSEAMNQSKYEEHQRIKTYTVGLYMDENQLGSDSYVYLDDVAEVGGGEAFNADSGAALASAFMKIVDLVDEQSRSVSSPGVAVNQMNRFEHLDQLYYSIFQPAISSFWDGNLKKYELVGSEIHGQTGNAVSDNTGYFSATSKSFWSDETDGYDATKGGARGELDDEGHRLFYTDADTRTNTTLPRIDWTKLDTDEGKPKTFFGLAAGASDETVEDFISKMRTLWADPMHSVPVLVNYGSAGQDADDQNNVVFVSTNAGMLHAIDAKDGSEKFTFMPYEFITQADNFTINRPGLVDNKRQLYGLDGSWVAWRRPGATAASAPSAVYLYGGMRRGGRSYYALDVSNVNAPKLKWQINGGSGDFEHMGQTWSTPTLTQVRVGDALVPVLVFGGGYSSSDHDRTRDYDAEDRSNEDEMGNAIYMVNANTGDLVWSATGDTVSAMKWAVPGSISVVDKNLDGVADHLYFGDLGGQVFRVDIDQSGGKSMAVHRLADFGGDDEDNRRFYEAPAITYVKEGFNEVLYVAIGSGYRAHPKDKETEEAFFVFRDEKAFNNPSAPDKVLSLGDLSEISRTGSEGADTTKDGWFYKLDILDGEKALSSPSVINGIVRFSTYSPVASTSPDNICAVSLGTSFIHTVNLSDGSPAATNDGSVSDSRSQELKQQTLPPTPVLLTNEDGEVKVVVGTEVVGDDTLGNMGLRKTRWYQMSEDTAAPSP
ncbi:MAG: hypothetical protein CL537_05795 [Alcanivoracaceae bacterium]|nr:hypothetical protein [Alcanivoracaceae bacterium]